MHVVSPMVLAVDGTITVDFRPEVEVSWMEFELKGKRNSVEELLACKGPWAITRGYELLQHDPVAASQCWYIGQIEYAMFWHVFDEDWDTLHYKTPPAHV